MSYKRKNVEKSKTPHPILEAFAVHKQFKSAIHDPGWIERELWALMNDGNFALHQMKTTIESVKSLDVSDYKEEVAKKKLTEPVVSARKALLSFLQKHIKEKKTDCERVYSEILRITEPSRPTEPVAAMLQELRYQEMREIIRSTDPKDRHHLLRSNVDFIKACIDSPDRLISPENLTTLRREFAFQQDPSLVNLENDTAETYQSVRRRAGEINATSIMMLSDEGLDDPITPPEHFEVFVPDSPQDKAYADQRVRSWQNEQNKIEARARFDAMAPGVNLTAERKFGFVEPRPKAPKRKQA